MRQQEIDIPTQLPFLQAICWDLHDVKQLTRDEMLNRYERGWANRGVLADLEGKEKEFARQLAVDAGSWIQVDV
jgi:hypothetical protein